VADNVLKFDFLANNKASPTFKELEKDSTSLSQKIGTLGKTTALALGGVALGGVAALAGAFKEGFTAADAYQKLNLKTAAVIKSTGNQAHISVKGVDELAAQLESLGTTDEELIINSQNVLATFTNIKNVGKEKIFDEATKSALDMSVALGSDLQGASIQVGKALNDPIKGVTALSKVGVSFTKQQKDQIKTMVDSGNTMGAQKLILGELNKEFGGAAKAAGSGFSGALFRAKDAVGDLERDIATKAMPTMTHLADWAANEAVPKIRVFTDWMMTDGKDRLVHGFQIARTAVEQTWSKLNLGGAVDFVKEAQSWATDILDGLNKGIGQGDWKSLGSTLGDGLSIALLNLGDMSASFLKMFDGIDWFGIGKSVALAALPFAVGFISNFGSNFLEVAKAHPFDMFIALASLLGVGKLGGIISKILERIPILKWFAPLFSKLEGLTAPINDRIGKLMSFFGKAFGDGFRRIFPEIGSGLWKRLNRLIDGVALRALYLKDAALKFIGGLVSGMGEGTGRVVRGVLRVIRFITSPWVNAARWLIGAGRDILAGLGRGIAGMAGSVGRWIGSAIRWVTKPWVSSYKWLASAGRNLLTGLRDGMFSAAASVGSWVGNIGGRIVRAVKNYFGIKSPSKVFGAIGSNLIKSLFAKMVDHNPVQAVTKIFGGMPQALGALVNKSLVKIGSLPGKAMNALQGLGGKFAGLFGGGGGELKIGGLSAAENWIIGHESGGRTTAANPTSTAFGLGQLLIANRERYGAILGVSPNTTDFGAQLQMFRMYVRDRYGTAENAKAFWQAHHWYGTGGMVNRPSLIGAGERGPERVLSPAQTVSFERLTRVLDRRGNIGAESPAGAAIDYTRLGDAVTRSFLRAKVSVTMDGRELGKVIGSEANMLGRSG